MIRIADTFTDSLARLTRDEQKAVKTTAFDLQVNPSSPGLAYHRLDRGRDRNFWSLRVSSDIRIIVHRSGDSVLLCYVDHHDAAYAWAERRKLEVHPRTGAAQFVVVRERAIEIPVLASAEPTLAPTARTAGASPPLGSTSRDELLGFGVPGEWVDDIRAASEDRLLEILPVLPQEAAEAVLALATGCSPQPAAAVGGTGGDPFEHPDALRRFRTLENVDEMARALDAPWEKWAVFLHPAQRDVVERRFGGPARVAGTAGTGKTVVALHRAVQLARRDPGARILLTTFSLTLVRTLRQKLKFLTGDDDALTARIVVDTLDDAARTIHEQSFGRTRPATPSMVESLLSSVSAEVGGHSFPDRFVFAEWHEVVDAWQIKSWEAYRDVPRLGRKTRIGEKQRAALWEVFRRTRERLEKGAVKTTATMLAEAAEEVAAGEPPFAAVVVDEAQDVNVPQLRFLAALAGRNPDALFFAGDLGQRIFQTPFSWKALGVDVRGRSVTLRINYRTSHQIRSQADRLLGPELADVDGNVEDRRSTVSVFNGPPPEILRTESEDAERDAIAAWLQARIGEGVLTREIAVFVRSRATVDRAHRAIEAAGLKHDSPAPGTDPESDRVVLLPMHRAKGLEFRAVVIACCDADKLPLQTRIETVGDDADLEEVYNSERHLLYVACTRARERLLVTGVEPVSEFIGDMELPQPAESSRWR